MDPQNPTAEPPEPAIWAGYDAIEDEDGWVRGRPVHRRPGEDEATWRARREKVALNWLVESLCDKAGVLLTEQGIWRRCRFSPCRRARACIGRRFGGEDVATWPARHVPLCRSTRDEVEPMMAAVFARDDATGAWLALTMGRERLQQWLDENDLYY